MHLAAGNVGACGRRGGGARDGKCGAVAMKRYSPVGGRDALAAARIGGGPAHRSLRLSMPSSIARASSADLVGAGRPTAAYFARARCRWVRTVVGAM